jgi:hypothetical protein
VASGPVRQAGGGGAAGDKSSPSGKTPDIGSTRYQYIAKLHTQLEQYQGFFVSISVYSDIFCNIWTTSNPISVKTWYRVWQGTGMSRYWPDIVADIGKKPNIGHDIGNIGFGKEWVCPDIVPI